MMNEDQLSIDALPDEILLNIFRMLPATEFVLYMPLVSEKWSRIIASDSLTLQRIIMYHENLVQPGAVKCFYARNKRERSEMIYWPVDDFVKLLLQIFKKRKGCINYKYDGHTRHIFENKFYARTRYAEIYKHIGTLMISSTLSEYATQEFTYIDRLTMLMFYGVVFLEQDQYTFPKLGAVHANVQDVMYMKCLMAPSFDLKFLHSEFRRLRRFRADHNSINIHFLDNLLHMHRHTLETVDLRDCVVTGDQWIHILLERLRGRTIKRLTMHSLYFTDRCVKKFLNAADLVLPDDRSNVIIDNDGIDNRISFYIDIDPIII